MRGDVLRLLSRYVLLAIAVVLLNFFIPRLLPGDPLSFGSGEGIDPAVPISGAVKDRLRAYYHLDEPLGSQLWSYLRDLARGDLSWSIVRPAPVRDLILDRLPWTLGLLLTSLLISAVVGTALGIAAGWSPQGRRERLLVSVTAGLSAVPEFLLAIGLLLALAIGLGWFPLLGGQTAFPDYGEGPGGLVRRGLDTAWHMTLPAIALTLAGTAGFLLIARDATADVRAAPWVVAARAKGLRERQIALRHVLPNIAFPLLTFLGLRLGAVLGGTLVVERVFNVPGLGLLAYQSIRARDYPVLQALFLLAGLGVLVANLGVELLYLRLERRRASFNA